MRIAIIVSSLAWLAAGCGGRAARYDGIERALARGDAPDTTSVLVMRGPEVVYARYFAGATPETLHDTRSSTKSLTALAVGIAVDRHALPGIDAPAFGYLAELAPFVYDGPAKAA